jgi:selenocysteine lyase/cysteine desulfurase
VNRSVEATRQAIAEYIFAADRRNIVFTYSCTDSLNMAILGLLRSGDHVVTSVVEHNSVLRPLKYLEETRSIIVSHTRCDQTGKFDPSEVIAAINSNTKLVALTHASNVTGAIQELASIGKHCQQYQIPFLVDAAQSIGHVSIDVRELGCDLLAAAGHKGLLGPLGTGFLFVSDRVLEQLTPLRFGGTGTSQVTDLLPTNVPEKFEAGNLNMPGILGLGAGLKYLRSDEGIERKERLNGQTEKILKSLESISSISLYGPRDLAERLPVFAFRYGEHDCHDISAILDARWSIETRAGLQCAPRLHQILGTDKWGGLVRVSSGLFTTDAQVDQLLEAIEAIAESL